MAQDTATIEATDVPKPESEGDSAIEVYVFEASRKPERYAYQGIRRTDHSVSVDERPALNDFAMHINGLFTAFHARLSDRLNPGDSFSLEVSRAANGDYSANVETDGRFYSLTVARRSVF